MADLRAELKDALHLLDLRQIEVIRQMVQQVNSDLQAYWELEQAIAVGLQRSTHKKLKLKAAEKVSEEEIAQALDEVEKEAEKQLMAVKAAVFNATNTLRQLHDRRKMMIDSVNAQAEEPEEDEEE